MSLIQIAYNYILSSYLPKSNHALYHLNTDNIDQMSQDFK